MFHGLTAAAGQPDRQLHSQLERGESRAAVESALSARPRIGLAAGEQLGRGRGTGRRTRQRSRDGQRDFPGRISAFRLRRYLTPEHSASFPCPYNFPTGTSGCRELIPWMPLAQLLPPTATTPFIKRSAPPASRQSGGVCRAEVKFRCLVQTPFTACINRWERPSGIVRHVDSSKCRRHVLAVSMGIGEELGAE